jgi:abequosyltransferase
MNSKDESGDTPWLTIGIPTHNGAATIRETLESIVSQLEHGVEIVISNNASTDETIEIIREYAAKSPTIRSYTNEKNLGFDRNVDLCVRRARAPFVWLFADDDEMRPGAINKVRRIVQRFPEVAAVYVDSLVPVVKEGAGYLCNDKEEFFRTILFRCGGLSSNVINKRIWQAVDWSRYLESGWIHFAYVLIALTKGPGYILNDSLKCEIPTGPKRWIKEDGSFFHLGLNLVSIFQEMRIYGYSPQFVRTACLTIKGAYWHIIPVARAKGLRLDRQLIKKCILLYGQWPSFWLVDLPLLFVPGPVHRALINAYRRVRTRERIGSLASSLTH